MKEKIVTVFFLYLPEDLTGQSHCLEPNVKMGSSEGAQSNANERRKGDSDKLGI